jgi:hypothetical protein
MGPNIPMCAVAHFFGLQPEGRSLAAFLLNKVKGQQIEGTIISCPRQRNNNEAAVFVHQLPYNQFIDQFREKVTFMHNNRASQNSSDHLH